MEENRQRDLRAQRTHDAIRQAFRELVCETDASRITVTAVAQRARIHRKTFYLHYTCIEALFEDAIRELCEGYGARIDAVDPAMPMRELNRVFFEWACGQDEFFERLLCEPSYREFSNKMILVNLRRNRARHNPYARYSEAQQSLINNFLVTSSNDLYRQWVADGKRLSQEELIDLSTRLLCTGVESLDLV